MAKNTHVYEILLFSWQRGHQEHQEHQEMSLPCLNLQVGKNLQYDDIITVVCFLHDFHTGSFLIVHTCFVLKEQ